MDKAGLFADTPSVEQGRFVYNASKVLQKIPICDPIE
jgi:hypothetical protein